MSHAVSGWYSTRSKIHSQRGRWKHRGRDTSLCECVRARVVYVCVREESLNVEYDEVINISLASAAGALGWNDPLRPRRSCNVVRTALHWQRAEWDKMKLKDELLKKKKKKKNSSSLRLIVQKYWERFQQRCWNVLSIFCRFVSRGCSTGAVSQWRDDESQASSESYWLWVTPNLELCTIYHVCMFSDSGVIGYQISVIFNTNCSSC